MEQSPIRNPNPLLSVTKDGIVNYSNDAASPLLHEWGVRVGGNLPSNMTDLVQRVISLNSPEKLEVKVGNKVYLVVFSPFPQKECVNISGFVITEQKKSEEIIQENEENYSQIAASTTPDSNVTKRKQADKVLFQSEQNYRLLYETMLQGVVYQDANGKIISMNPAAERILGKTSGEFLGSSSVGEEYHTIREDGSKFPGLEHPAMVSLHTGQKVQNIVMGVYNPREKGYRWINISAMPLFRPGEDKPFQVYAIFEDITDRKQAEEKSRINETRLVEAQRLAKVGSWNWDIVKDDIFWSEQMYNMFERTSELTPPKYNEHFLYFTPESWTRLDNAVNKALKFGESYELELEHVRKDGVHTWQIARGEVVHDNYGHIIGLRGTVQDITERKQMEEQTRQRAEETETVMEVAPVAIFIGHDPQCNNITGNQMANEFYGVKHGENVSANTTCVRRFFRKGHELTANELPIQKAAFKNIDVRNEEVDILFPSGEYRTLLGSASPLYDAENNVRGSVAAFIDITERKKAEARLEETLENLEYLVKERTEELEKAYKSLKESERGLAEAQEIAHIGNWIRDFATGEIHWSDEVYRIFGFKPQEFGINYESFLSRVHSEDRDYVDNKIKESLSKLFYDLEYRIVRADNEEHILHENVKVICDKENNPIQLKGTVQDITERKQAEESIRYLASIVESSNDAIVTRSFEGIITSWNKGAEQTYGYSAEEILGKNVTSLIPPSSNDKTEALIEIIKKGKKVCHYETLRLRKDGTIINVSLSFSPVFDTYGELTAISVIARDITRRKKAEEALRKSKEQYQTLFNSMSEGFANYEAIYDEHGSLYDLLVLDINPAGAKISGVKRETQLGKTWREIWPDIEDYWLEAYQKVDQTDKSIQFEGFSNITGRYYITQIDRIVQGEFAVVFRDITEEKEDKEALAKYEIAQKKEIHHRIKNNLQIISALLELQAEKLKGRTDISSSELLNAFKESQDRITSMAMIHEELYRGGGTDKLNFSSYIGKLAENLIITYRVGNKDISLDMDLEENTFFDTDTAIPLGMIVNELVSNSFKYAFQGRDKGEIRIRLLRDKNIEYKNKGCVSYTYVLSVSDNGVGIPENIDIENLDSLGLQLVTTLADQLNGELEIKRSNGAEFTIRFKVTEKTDQAQADLKFAGGSA